MVAARREMAFLGERRGGIKESEGDGEGWAIVIVFCVVLTSSRAKA